MSTSQDILQEYVGNNLHCFQNFVLELTDLAPARFGDMYGKKWVCRNYPSVFSGIFPMDYTMGMTTMSRQVLAEILLAVNIFIRFHPHHCHLGGSVERNRCFLC